MIYSLVKTETNVYLWVNINKQKLQVFLCCLLEITGKFNQSSSLMQFVEDQVVCRQNSGSSVQQPQLAQAKDKRTPLRYKLYCVTKTRFKRVCMGMQRLCFRRYKIKFFVLYPVAVLYSLQFAASFSGGDFGELQFCKVFR